MAAQTSPESDVVSIYWRKRHTVEKMIHDRCSLEVGKDYEILHPEKRNIDNYTGIIITLKGSNAIINKSRVENIFSSSEVKPFKDSEKKIILSLRNISPSKDHVLIPVALPQSIKTDIGIMLNVVQALEVILKLHEIRKIIGVSENAKPTSNQMVFNYFNDFETKLAIDFFTTMGFSFNRPNKNENKLLFILELPDDFRYEKDDNLKPVERKFSFSNEEILKLVEWECNHRLCSKLKITGRVNGDKELSTRFVPNLAVKIECIEKSLQFLKETYQIESFQDQAEPNTFYIKLKQTNQQTTKMSGKGAKGINARVYEILSYLPKYTPDSTNDKLCVKISKPATSKYVEVFFLKGTKEERSEEAKKSLELLIKNDIPCRFKSENTKMTLILTGTESETGAKKVDLSELGESFRVFIEMLTPEQKDFLFPQKPVAVSEVNPAEIIGKISEHFFFISKKNPVAKALAATPDLFEENLVVLKKIKIKK